MEAEKSNAAKDFLLQAKKCDILIKSKLEQKAKYESLREKSTSSWGTERVSGSMDNDRMCDTTAKILEIEKELNDEIDSLKSKRKEVENIIRSVRNTRQFELLCKVYLENKSLEKAACEMDTSFRNAKYIHKNALYAVYGLLKGVVL